MDLIPQPAAIVRSATARDIPRVPFARWQTGGRQSGVDKGRTCTKQASEQVVTFDLDLATRCWALEAVCRARSSVVVIQVLVLVVRLRRVGGR